MKERQKQIRKLTLTAILMSMVIILSTSWTCIPVPGGHLYFNDTVIVLASIVLDPVYAFAVGGLGAFLGDLILYPQAMFVSLFAHGLQAIAISIISHKALKKKPVVSSIIGALVGAVIMVIGYTIGRAFVYSTPEYAIIKLPFEVLQAALGVVFGPLLVWKLGFGKIMKKVLREE